MTREEATKAMEAKTLLVADEEKHGGVVIRKEQLVHAISVEVDEPYTEYFTVLGSEGEELVHCRYLRVATSNDTLKH